MITLNDAGEQLIFLISFSMYFKTITCIGITLGLIVLAGCSTTSENQVASNDATDVVTIDTLTAEQQSSAPIVVVLGSDPAPLNFGNISMRDGTVSRTYMLKNDRNVPSKLMSVATSCMCTTAEIDGQQFGMPGMSATNSAPTTVIAPGATQMLVVTFDPNAHGPNGVGPMQREVYIMSDDSRDPQTRIKFMGVVTQ